MPALIFNPIAPFGVRTIVAGGTPQLLFTTTEAPIAAAGVWPMRVTDIRVEAANANTGLIYIGVKGMVAATGVGVLFTLAAPGSNPIVNAENFSRFFDGTNRFRLQDYWVDGTTGEGVLRTCWIN
jgi:hypothetical protein